MEIIQGKHSSFIDSAALQQRFMCYSAIHLDIGTGDGRFVQHLAQSQPTWMVIGVDACRENLIEVSRRAPTNALFVIANARQLPCELSGLASRITINFPWGSLLEGLAQADSALFAGLIGMARSNASLDIRLNGGALSEIGYSLEQGTDRVRQAMVNSGFRLRSAVMMSASDLKAYPTTWAKRLAFGRDPRAMWLRCSR